MIIFLRAGGLSSPLILDNPWPLTTVCRDPVYPQNGPPQERTGRSAEALVGFMFVCGLGFSVQGNMAL